MKGQKKSPSHIINFIHKFSKEFIEKHISSELLYFDDLWEIYEPQLRRWLGRPSKKILLKLPKRRAPKVVGMADDSQKIEITPKIVEGVTTSYKELERMGEGLSMEKVEVTLKRNWRRKLPYSVILQAVGLFAPHMFKDLKKTEDLIESEKADEYAMNFHIEKDEPTNHEEKKAYKIYSHEKPKKPYPASKEEVEDLRKLSSEEKNKRFHIFFDDEKGQIVVKKQIKKFVGEEGREKLRLKKLLYLILINVGNRISYSKIKFDVMRTPTDKDEDDASDSAVQQLKKRLCEFTKQELFPFIEPSTKVESGAKGYLIKEEAKGKKFKYCMILRSEEQYRKT